MKLELDLDINGQLHVVHVFPHETLLDTLRGPLGLTGTKTNCLDAECGVCNVEIDGRVVNACTTLSAQCRGSAVTTIEGLARGCELHPLQRAFIEHGAVQCGYCIPGMILNARALLAENPHPTRDEIREALAGTLCRCTGYQKILDAVEAAATGIYGDAAR